MNLVCRLYIWWQQVVGEVGLQACCLVSCEAAEGRRALRPVNTALKIGRRLTGLKIVRKVLMRGCELGSETAGLEECPAGVIIGQEGIRCGSWCPCRACGATQKWADRGRAGRQGQPCQPPRLTCNASQQLPQYMQSGCLGTPNLTALPTRPPRGLLSLFLSLPYYFGHSPLLFPVLFVSIR